MYSGLKGQVKCNGILSNLFNIMIGLRQGCNLSPHLFNIYINDLPLLLKTAECYPVSLNGEKINILAYADDMLILSNSEWGLKKSLQSLQGYCRKWQLVLNESKTKIIIFNTTKTSTAKFTFEDKKLEVVKQHTYLGIKIHRSGNFTVAIKDLYERANKAYYAAKSIMKDCQVSPRLLLRIFDAVVKPILTYCSEIWGAFGIKKDKYTDLLSHLLSYDKYPYEKLHIKMCKQSLYVPKRTSNIGCLAELGRVPIMASITTAILKYYVRIKYSKEYELVNMAIKSQDKLVQNSSKTMTFGEMARTINDDLELNDVCTNGEFSNQYLQKMNNIKSAIKSYGKRATRSCFKKYEEYFLNKLRSIRINNDSKLWLYSQIKSKLEYESYLDVKSDYRNELTKFRLSIHWLPIERLRYKKPKIERHERLCMFCKADIGSEMHVLMECQHSQLINLRQKFDKLFQSSTENQSKSDILFKILSGQDHNQITIICKFIKEVNDISKKLY